MEIIKNYKNFFKNKNDYNKESNIVQIKSLQIHPYAHELAITCIIRLIRPYCLIENFQ